MLCCQKYFGHTGPDVSPACAGESDPGKSMTAERRCARRWPLEARRPVNLLQPLRLFLAVACSRGVATCEPCRRCDGAALAPYVCSSSGGGGHRRGVTQRHRTRRCPDSGRRPDRTPEVRLGLRIDPARTPDRYGQRRRQNGRHPDVARYGRPSGLGRWAHPRRRRGRPAAAQLPPAGSIGVHVLGQGPAALPTRRHTTMSRILSASRHRAASPCEEVSMFHFKTDKQVV